MSHKNPTTIFEAINDLCRQEKVEATNDIVQRDFVFELVHQYPLLLLEYISKQVEMEITATSTVVFS